MKKFMLLFVIMFSLFLTSCSNDSDDDTGPIINDPPPSNDPVTYTNTVKAIIDSNCLNCHTNPPVNSAPMALTTYTNVKDAVQNRGLIAQIESGDMPVNASMLSSSQIQAVKDWQTDGLLE